MMYPAPRGGRIVIHVRVSNFSILGVILTVIGLLVACSATDGVGPAIARTEDLRETHSPVLIRALDQGSTEDRVRAAIAMGRVQDDGYAAGLAAASQDDVPEVRRAALFALGQLGLAEGALPSSVAVDACLASLDSDDATDVASAVEALGKLAPDEIAPTIAARLEHPSDAVRTQAAHALFRLRFVPVWRRQATAPPALPESAVQALSEALSDPSVGVRRAVAHAFSRYGQPLAAIALQAVLDDDDEWVRMFTIRALGRSGDAGSVPHLVALLGDDSAHVRVEAVNSIVALGGVDRMSPELARDPSHHVRAALAIALTQFLIVPKLNVQAAGTGPETAAVADAVPEIGVLVGLEEIIVTLQSEGKVPRYLRIHVNLEMVDQTTADLVVARLPQLRDAVIMTLSAKSPEDLQRPEGRKGIRDEIFRRLADKLPKDSLQNIYFSDLVIQ